MVGIRAAAAGAATEVVDDDAGAAPAQLDGLGAADAARTAGDDDDVAVESNLVAHVIPLLQIG